MGRLTPAEQHTKRRQKDHALELRAAMDPGPEGKIAAAMLAKRRSGELELPEPERLALIADDIRAEWSKSIDRQFEVGHLLNQARDLFPRSTPSFEKSGDREFGRWFKAQAFPFSYATSWLLRSAASREPEARAYIAGLQGLQGRTVGVPWAMSLMLAKPKPGVPTAEEKAAALAAAEAKDAEGTPAFVAFRNAAAALDVSQLPADELAELAGIIKELAAAYNAERTRR